MDTNKGASQKDDSIKIDINNGSEEEIPHNKMQKIVDKIGLENAIDCEEGIEDILSNSYLKAFEGI